MKRGEVGNPLVGMEYLEMTRKSPVKELLTVLIEKPKPNAAQTARETADEEVKTPKRISLGVQPERRSTAARVDQHIAEEVTRFVAPLL
ncbi:MAG TPA: hypothetical protein VE932_16610 [Patescibacteria group bacterium]|nr:hypothetical protein [Patescibacteria group bacterium]